MGGLEGFGIGEEDGEAPLQDEQLLAVLNPRNVNPTIPKCNCS